VQVVGTGVLVRSATDDEIAAMDRARSGDDHALEGFPSYHYTENDPAPAGFVPVVTQAFVEFTRSGDVERWASFEHHGHSVPGDRDATLELLALVEEAVGDLREDLFPDMRIDGLDVTRWEFNSAPRRLELAPELEARLAPLRRG